MEHQQSRERKHPHSELAKAPRDIEASTPTIHVGDLVYITSDRNKSSARDRYLVASVEDRWCFIRKFSGHQLGASSYKVKLSECYLVPNARPTTEAPPQHHDTRDFESDEHTPTVSFDEVPQTTLTIATPLEVPVLPTPTDERVAEIDTPGTPTIPAPRKPDDDTRPVRRRTSGLNLYLCLFTNKSSSLNVVNRVNYWRMTKLKLLGKIIRLKQLLLGHGDDS